MEFLPYSTHFLGFMIQYIPDINFKISLTTIKIICMLFHSIQITYIAKLLQLNGINFKKYYQQLVTSLIEKLSDSKVVIRQAVLKACSLLITVKLFKIYLFPLEFKAFSLRIPWNEVSLTSELACQRRSSQFNCTLLNLVDFIVSRRTVITR